jgi:hypothetical protein
VVVDYERAWTMLAATIASKTQHGREPLLTEMAQIARRCEVPAGELSRLLRLYGVEVERARSIAAETDRAEAGSFDGGLVSASEADLTGHHGPGGHDGSVNGSTNGRRRV